MSTRPDQFPRLAKIKANTPEVAALFEILTRRADACAKLQDVFLDGIINHREARTGKPFDYSKRQKKMIAEFDADAEKALRDQEQHVAAMDDPTLLASALSGEQFQLQQDEDMLSAYREEDRDMAARIIEFCRETARQIQAFIEKSPFREKVLLIVPRKKWKAVS